MLSPEHKKLIRKVHRDKGEPLALSNKELGCLAFDDRQVVLELMGRVNELHAALTIVSAGIWRNKKQNTCGLAGAALAVHAVEHALGIKR